MQGFNLIVNISKQSFVRNLLILIALTGTMLFSWLAGHILRYSILALWHPPIQETNPHIENGYQFELENKRLILPQQAGPWVSIGAGGMQLYPSEQRVGMIYYTSLPAKCQSASGELVRVEESPSKITLGP